VGEVGTLQLAAHRPVARRTPDQLQVALTGFTAASNQPFGYLKDAGMHVMDSRLAMWSLVQALSPGCDQIRGSDESGGKHLIFSQL
jgi:hypothetical protein